MTTKSALFQNLRLSGDSASLPSTIPAFLYGCAWKKNQTADLVYQALNTGFRGIDVAAQPKHYREDLVGDGMRRALADGKVKRGDLFIQTKFTAPGGQDPSNVPYDPRAAIKEQVKASVASSLHNLRVSDDPSAAEGTYLDSIVLHSPLKTIEETQEAWRALEHFHPNQVRYLGISNTTLPIVKALYDSADVKPSFVQNRFYAETHFDTDIRQFCREKGLIYQSFWTLTANAPMLRTGPVQHVAKRAEVDPAVVFYALVMSLENTIILNGTKTHMTSDLEGLEKVRSWVQEPANEYDWQNTTKHFRDLIQEIGPAANQM